MVELKLASLYRAIHADTPLVVHTKEVAVTNDPLQFPVLVDQLVLYRRRNKGVLALSEPTGGDSGAMVSMAIADSKARVGLGFFQGLLRSSKYPLWVATPADRVQAWLGDCLREMGYNSWHVVVAEA